MAFEPTKIRALLFDVFGTCVDWRSTVTAALHEQAHTTLNDPTASLATAVRLRASDLTLDDWGRFAQEWRNAYKTFVRDAARALEESQKSGNGSAAAPAFKSVDEHHLDSLRELLARWQLGGLWTPAQVQRLSLVWHFLAPWPDSAAGIGALNGIGRDGGATLATATLSNGNRALLEDLTAHAKLPFKLIFSAEDFGAYKPHPKTYLGAAERLGLRPEECALVAAHLGDLWAAKQSGLQAVYVERAREEEWCSADIEKAKVEGWVGLWVGEREGGFERVAELLRQKSEL